MADSSYEKNLSELAKMKVADLKAELKQRGLPTTGNKTELVERLQLSIHESSLSLDETNDEIIDEDAVLADEEIESELTTKPDSQVAGDKRKSTTEENGTAAKKIVLNRKNIVEEVKVNTPKEEEKKTEKNGEDKEPEKTEKKVIKLSEVSTNERLEMRAKKFGVPLTDAAKKEARAARFGSATSNGSNRSAASIKSSNVDVSLEVLKRRAERFGTSNSSLLEKAELDEKKEKRKARFGEVKPIEKVSATKVKLGK